MTSRILPLSLLLVLLLKISPISGQELEDIGTHRYLWPTDASQYLTSSFGEYRNRRFHMGIDVKTWGKTGYKCFAVRNGYIWRIAISPNGYGKSLYLKLDTGEIAVYAHLAGFPDEIEELVIREQERQQRYRVNLYFNPDQRPVRQGDIIAFTGQTGIGAPHLHFEIRTARNVPVNPLGKLFDIPDRISPIVTKIALTPLDAESEVDGDFEPVVVTPKWIKPGEYEVTEAFNVWGKVGVAVAAFDKAASQMNGYGVYSLHLFVDDVLRFQYSYDEISFDFNSMVELERDYRLRQRNHGHFHKLYKDQFNDRKDYWPNETWAGALKSASLFAETDIDLTTSDAAGTTDAFETGTLFPGPHDFRIELRDYSGNTTKVTGKLHVGQSFEIQPGFTDEDDGRLLLSEIITFDLRKVEDLNAYYLRHNRWTPLSASLADKSGFIEERGGDGYIEEVPETANTFLFDRPASSPLIMKLIGRDQFGASSYPYFFVEPSQVPNSVEPKLSADYDFYDDYVRLQVTSDHILGSVPELTLYPGRLDSQRVPLFQTDLREYVGRLKLKALQGEFHPLRFRCENVAGEAFATFDFFETVRVRPKETDALMARDQNFWMNFWSGSLYRPLYANIAIDSLSRSRRYNFESHIYRVTPKDALLDQGTFVHIKYSGQEERPEQLGVYFDAGRGRWRFIDNKVNEKSQTISAKTQSLEDFALIRDAVPPEIGGVWPKNQSHITDSTPRLSIYVRDRLSGIENENDIEILLDGRYVIGEYDPERSRIVYQCRSPLGRGRHEIRIQATDKCRNVSSLTSEFWVD